MAKRIAPECGASELTDLGRKVRKLRLAMRLTKEELAELADLSPSVISLIESGRRSVSMDTLEALSAALGVPKSYWFTTWSLEEFVYTRPEVYNDLLNWLGKEGEGEEADYAVTRRLAPGSRSAHGALVDQGLYRYVSVGKAAREGVLRDGGGPGRRPLSALPTPLFRGGVMQSVVFETHVRTIEELVLDSHQGEETIVVLDGSMDLVVMARPDQLQRLIVGKKCPTTQVRIAPTAVASLIQRYREDERYKDDHQMLAWLEDHRHSARVPCEVVRLEQGFILENGSEWPHGFKISEDRLEGSPPPRALVVTFGSYFAGSIPQQEDDDDGERQAGSAD